MALDWDVEKAETNFNKHGVRFSETESVCEDDTAITITDDDSEPSEQRFIAIGAGA